MIGSRRGLCLDRFLEGKLTSATCSRDLFQNYSLANSENRIAAFESDIRRAPRWREKQAGPGVFSRAGLPTEPAREESQTDDDDGGGGGGGGPWKTTIRAKAFDKGAISFIGWVKVDGETVAWVQQRAGGLNIYTLMPMRRFEHQRRANVRIAIPRLHTS
ncbi:hypothetical protein K0M31_007558 [Melipona bicolor]|uniref:Uncharacterized protein n=1 Tax=Melipona bicolor TaxID=60889 RepID=A0AA40GBN1_9HYME|nr:hypothetical protein K0M31_007558 [Melipona bicolor]